MEQILADCENSVNYIDDVLVFGENELEHDKALDKVMKALKSRDVLLNQNKCVFKVTEIMFLGHTLSSTGIRPAEEKTNVLKSFRTPVNAEELRSFLGMVTYVGRFLPDLATATAPLRDLIRKDVPFEWSVQHDAAFGKIKLLISEIGNLHYFDNNLRTRLIADASPVALGAVLLQFSDTDGSPRLISYASKSLSETEKRYCQTEKEALALVWAVERFAVYLIGRRFELETDHKPLEAIFAPASKPCARIERWVLRLQSFRFVVKYRKGSSNIADPFSRLATASSSEDFDKDNQFMVLAILESVAVDISEIEANSSEDVELKILRECIMSGKWDKPEVKLFEVFRDELGMVGNILVRGNKMIVPSKLRSRILELAHEGHPGESVMKRRLRERVWWPLMDKDAVKLVSNCEGCRLVSLPSHPEPMQRRPLPSRPWIDVALDFLGPLPTGEYLLVIIDYYSRYKEIEVMTRITAKDTIDRLHKIFTRLGFPVTLTLDNARQFISGEFDQYCSTHGIHLNNTTPYWPQENGLVERQNRSVLKRLQISHALKRDWKADLYDYLMMYYTTPHSVTGKTPTEMCFGRTIRSKLPYLSEVEVTPSDMEVADKDQIAKQKGKEQSDAKRRATPSNIVPGDTVVLKNLLPQNKLATAFGPTEYVVLNKTGARVTVQNTANDKVYQRNSAHVKRVSKDNEDGGKGDVIKSNQSEVLDTGVDDNRRIDDVSSRGRRNVRFPKKYEDYVTCDQTSRLREKGRCGSPSDQPTDGSLYNENV